MSSIATPPTTRVVHVKREPFDVYIGRAMPGFRPSVFANRFRIGEDGSREDVIAAYKQDLLARLSKDEGLQAQLRALKGLRLACWCKPQACHGDVLVELLEGRAPQETPPPPLQESLF